MASSYQDDYIKTALRLPRELHADLMDAAREQGRSFNAEIIARLQSSFQQVNNIGAGPFASGSGGSHQVSEMTRAASQINELQGQRNTLAIVVSAYGGREEDDHIRQLKAQLKYLDLQIAGLVRTIQSLHVEGLDLVTAGQATAVVSRPDGPIVPFEPPQEPSAPNPTIKGPQRSGGAKRRTT